MIRVSDLLYLSIVIFISGLLFTSGSAIGGAHEQAGVDHSSMDHSDHSMMGHSTERDEEGRRLYGMTHKVSPAMADELRQKLPTQKNSSDAQISLMMKVMGGNYAWYLSDEGMQGEQGVLILLHSSRDGDPLFKAKVEDIGDIFPTAMAPGMAMAMSDHIQLALDDLKAAGADTIVVVPILATKHNTLMRQWNYIFGREDEAAYGSVPRISTDAELLFLEPPGDDPIIAEILIDHAMEISENPSNEVVIVAAHGPVFEDDNQKVKKELDNLAKIIREDGGFADAHGISLQDDAPKEIRDANVDAMRQIVEEANKNGQKVIVVTNLTGTRTIQSALRKDLQGLEYSFNSKGVSEHPNYVLKWMADSISNELELYTMQKD